MKGKWEEFPEGNGNPDCKKCRGRGVVPIPKKERPDHAVGEQVQACVCTFVQATLINMEQGWRGLSKGQSAEESPLRGRECENLWVTASAPDLKAHVRHVAARMGPNWPFKLLTDADLMDAWLSKDLDVYDADVSLIRQMDASKFDSLMSASEYPDLMILKLGVKAARNSAMPEVLLEVLYRRLHLEKATWIVDNYAYPLSAEHISYDGLVGEVLSDWPHILIEQERQEAALEEDPFFDPDEDEAQGVTQSTLNTDAELDLIEKERKKK